MPLKEFELLELLLRNAGRVLTRGQLIDRVWGSDYFGDTKTLDVHIKRIRSRIEEDPSEPRCCSPSAASATGSRAERRPSATRTRTPPISQQRIRRRRDHSAIRRPGPGSPSASGRRPARPASSRSGLGVGTSVAYCGRVPSSTGTCSCPSALPDWK